jgi:hypothetical protein
MNTYLFDRYKKLNDTERSEFAFRFKDSPVATRLIGFLEKGSLPGFKIRAAIDVIYGNEKGKVEYSILENRYFKLRKKLLDELGNSGKNDVVQQHTDEELKFFKAKNLVSSANKDAGYKMLVELEKECWAKNIFELLVPVIDQLIFCNQSFNKIENNKMLYVRLKKAIGLQADINKAIMIARRVYEISYSKGVIYAKKELASLKQFAVKHKHYPRFSLCYHHVSAYYKLGSTHYLNEMQVVSRHLSEFKRLQAAYSLVPVISYKVNYVQLQHMHFNQMMMTYHFNRCEFEEAYQELNEMWIRMSEENSIYKVYKTESSYYNMVTAQCMAGRYPEANNTVNEFMQHLKTNHQQDKLVFANTLKARVYSEIYPQTLKMDPQFLMEQMEEYIKIVRKSDNIQVSLDQSLVLKIKMLILAKKYPKALQVLKDPAVESYLGPMKLTGIFSSLIRTLSDEPLNAQKLVEIGRSVQLIKNKANTPAEYMNLIWLQRKITRLAS